VEVTNCDFSVTSTRVGRGVPSPSDTLVQLEGTVDLSNDGAVYLQTHFKWDVTRREDIPKSLQTSLPIGDFLVSKELNETFSKNPTYRHGFVVVMKDNWSRTYFLVNDKDHPIR